MFDAILPELKIPAFPVHITTKVIPVTNPFYNIHQNNGTVDFSSYEINVNIK